jgi:hypothetical protein
MKISPWFVVMILISVVSLACGGQSWMPNMPTFPSIPSRPGTANVPTGSSPMSGDWQVQAEFGHFAFTVDPDGKNVTTAVFDLSDWTCGGTTLTTGLQSISLWPISDGQFGGNVNLNGNFHTMTVIGTYNEAGKTFSGEWQEHAHGSTCSGKWQAVPRK